MGTEIRITYFLWKNSFP